MKLAFLTILRLQLNFDSTEKEKLTPTLFMKKQNDNKNFKTLKITHFFFFFQFQCLPP